MNTMNLLASFFDVFGGIALFVMLVGAIVVVGIIILAIRCYQKVQQGKAIVRNGLGATRVSFSGIVVVPVIHPAWLEARNRIRSATSSGWPTRPRGWVSSPLARNVW